MVQGSCRLPCFAALRRGVNSPIRTAWGGRHTSSLGSCHHDSSKRNWKKIPVKASFWKGSLCRLYWRSRSHRSNERLSSGRHQGGWSSNGSSPNSNGEDATAVTAQSILRWLNGSELQAWHQHAAGLIVHYTFGASTATAYGGAVERLPWLAGGVPFGCAIWLGAHLIAVPALGVGEVSLGVLYGNGVGGVRGTCDLRCRL
jgi:hypothetical protein